MRVTSRARSMSSPMRNRGASSWRISVSACNSPSTRCLMTPERLFCRRVPRAAAGRFQRSSIAAPTMATPSGCSAPPARLSRNRGIRAGSGKLPAAASLRGSLPPAIGRRITTHCKGVGERQERAAFSATGNMGAAFDNADDCIGQTVALRDVIPAERRSIFIKSMSRGRKGHARRSGIPVARGGAVARRQRLSPAGGHLEDSFRPAGDESRLPAVSAHARL